jgi:hypothetical protein
VMCRPVPLQTALDYDTRAPLAKIEARSEVDAETWPGEPIAAQE